MSPVRAAVALACALALALGHAHAQEWSPTKQVRIIVPVIERYNREVVKILNQPDIRDKLLAVEFEMVAGSPEQFGEWIRTEIIRWGRVIKQTGAKAN